MRLHSNVMRFCFSVLSWVLFKRLRSLIFSVTFVLLSFVAEMAFHWQGFFSCSGAIVTLAGLFLNIKNSLHFHLNIPKRNLHNLLSGAMVFGSEPTEEDYARVDDIIQDEIYGTAFMVIGTLIWAYGSYFVNIFH